MFLDGWVGVGYVLGLVAAEPPELGLQLFGLARLGAERNFLCQAERRGMTD